MQLMEESQLDERSGIKDIRSKRNSSQVSLHLMFFPLEKLLCNTTYIMSHNTCLLLIIFDVSKAVR